MKIRTAKFRNITSYIHMVSVQQTVWRVVVFVVLDCWGSFCSSLRILYVHTYIHTYIPTYIYIVQNDNI